MRSGQSDADDPLTVTDDGLYTPTIKRHSLEKIRLHNRYARIFTTAMRQKWPQLAYIGLYSGAGRASIEGANRIVETSALSVLRLPNSFTHHVFVDNNPDCISALDQRWRAIESTATVALIPKDVNESVPAVRAALPSWSRSKGLLSFCFVDPFDTTLKFDTRPLSTPAE